MTDQNSPLFRIAAPILFVLLWSTGFIGAKLGLPYVEPFTFLFLRMALTTLLLLVAALLFRQPWPASPRQALHAVVAGTGVHFAYLGGVFAGIKLGASAGVTALIVGMQPLLIAALSQRLFGEKVTARQWGGLAMGLAGVALVVGHRASLSGGLLPYLPAVLALAGITLGTAYQKKYCAAMPLVTGTLIQYAAASLLFGAVALACETRQVQWSGEFLFALAWLTLVLSVGAIFLLFLMIRHGQAARVSSLFYLTPPFTALFAWALFGETLSMPALAGFVLAAIGVTLARK